MNEKRIKLIVILLIVILIAVMVDITIRVLPSAKPKQQPRCLAVPAKFIMEYPDCANKLVQAANLTNIHIVSPGTLWSRRYNQSVEADNTNGFSEVNNITHAKICAEQWRLEIITLEEALHCIDRYIESTK
jgi:hypothetical protein